MNRCQFVADHRARYGVKRLCQVLGIARSSFYHWQATATVRAARRVADERTTARIRAVHTASDGTYCWVPFKIVTGLPLPMVMSGDEKSPPVGFRRAV